jgi:hypothetical protein
MLFGSIMNWNGKRRATVVRQAIQNFIQLIFTQNHFAIKYIFVWEYFIVRPIVLLDTYILEFRKRGQGVIVNRQELIKVFFFPTLIPLSEVGTCFLPCCDKDSAIIFTTGRLPDVNPP